jgi:hypothetical protein
VDVLGRTAMQTEELWTWLVKKKEMVNEYFITSTNIRVKATQIITLLKHFVLVQHCLDTEPATSNREIHKIKILHGGIP